MSKYFIFMYIEEPQLNNFLNLAIYTLNPQERWPAHVTIAGPFDRTIDVPRSLHFRQQVSILGRGRFDNGAHQTIFLHVGSRDLHSRVRKPDYPNAIPHLTLYNGRDRKLADLLYEELARVKPYGVFHSSRLEVVESKQQYNFNFRVNVDPRLLAVTKDMSLDDLKRLAPEERVKIAVLAIQVGFAGSLRRAAMDRVLGRVANHR